MDRCFVFLSMRATYREAAQTATGSLLQTDGLQCLRTPSVFIRREGAPRIGIDL